MTRAQCNHVKREITIREADAEEKRGLPQPQPSPYKASPVYSAAASPYSSSSPAIPAGYPSAVPAVSSPKLQPPPYKASPVYSAVSSPYSSSLPSIPAGYPSAVPAVSSSKLPHNCEAILRHADTPLNFSDKFIMDHLYKGVFLNHKKQKYWVDSRSNSNCFMLYPKDLSITWSENMNYWVWFSLKESPNDTLVDVVELKNVCWLDITGKFDTRNLTPGITYEVVFVVKLEDPAYGWDAPVNVKLTLPTTQGRGIPERNVNMREKLRYHWLDIPAGEFVTSPENAGEIKFSMYEHDSGVWKKGMFVKGIAIRPKSR